MSKSSSSEEEVETMTMTMTMEEEEEEEEEEVFVNWLELPEHLFFEILAKFTCFDDYIRFGTVCVTWRSLLFSEHCPELPTQLPLLIVPTPLPPLHEEEDDADVVGEKNKNNRKKKKKNKKKKNNTTLTQSCSFYRITDNKVYNHLQLAMPFNRHFRGSGHGWFVTMDDDGLFYPVRLINPFFFPKPCKEIELPPITNLLAVGEDDDGFKEIIFLRKAVLSADPISNPKDYIVMVIYGGFQKLAFYKPGGDKEAWTLVESEYEDYQGPFQDIIFYKHKFYALHYYGELFVCDLERRIAEEIVESMPGLERCLQKYLVESSGDLLLVLRFVDANDVPYKSTIGFNVFKLLFLDDPKGEFLRHYLDDPLSPEMDGIEPQWVQVNDLQGCAIFIGYNGSLSVSAANFPGVKPNCIYYTDNDRETFHCNPGYCGLGQDFGLFNLEDGRIEKHFPTEMGKETFHPPIWIEPPKPQNIIRKKLIK